MDNPKIEAAVGLPPELADKASDTMAALRTACDMQSTDMDLAQRLAEHARTMLHAACSHYKPDSQDGLRVLCDSGNLSRTPYRGRHCVDCPVGQVIRKDDHFHFIGTQPTIEDELVQIIFNT
jgi:hypothetical protein